MKRQKIDYGIDLGTTNSSICRMENGNPVLFRTDTLREVMPSCISFTRRQNIKVGDSATIVALEEKAQDIDTLFNERPYGEFNTHGRPTADGTEYLFSIERGGWNQDHIALNLYDFPGEWLTSKDKDKHKILEDRMKECGIIIIAIDTPYLMEPLSDVEKKPDRVGNWNDQRNYCRRITEMVKKNFTHYVVF